MAQAILAQAILAYTLNTMETGKCPTCRATNFLRTLNKIHMPEAKCHIPEAQCQLLCPICFEGKSVFFASSACGHLVCDGCKLKLLERATEMEPLNMNDSHLVCTKCGVNKKRQDFSRKDKKNNGLHVCKRCKRP